MTYNKIVNDPGIYTNPLSPFVIISTCNLLNYNEGNTCFPYLFSSDTGFINRYFYFKFS